MKDISYFTGATALGSLGTTIDKASIAGQAGSIAITVITSQAKRGLFLKEKKLRHVYTKTKE